MNWYILLVHNQSVADKALMDQLRGVGVKSWWNISLWSWACFMIFNVTFWRMLLPVIVLVQNLAMAIWAVVCVRGFRCMLWYVKDIRSAGLSTWRKYFVQQSIPHREMLPVGMEEQVICFWIILLKAILTEKHLKVWRKAHCEVWRGGGTEPFQSLVLTYSCSIKILKERFRCI